MNIPTYRKSAAWAYLLMVIFPGAAIFMMSIETLNILFFVGVAYFLVLNKYYRKIIPR